MGRGAHPRNGMLALLLRAVMTFFWDAAVSPREATKGRAARWAVSRLCGSTCDTANHQPHASMKGSVQD